jgi:UDP:flavonoid glycosyltransferase YjiC (YdhE family)
MRVLFTTLPGYGSYQPLAPVARALIEAGHDIRFAASATFCRVIARAGFRCIAAGFDWSLDDKDAVFASVRATLEPQTMSLFVMSSPVSWRRGSCPTCWPLPMRGHSMSLSAIHSSSEGA